MKNVPNCKTCKVRWFCIVACEPVNEQLARIDKELNRP